MRRAVKTLLPVGIYLLGLTTSMFMGVFRGLFVKVAVILVGGLLSLTLSYYNEYKPAVDVERERLNNFLDSFLYPRLIQKYRLALEESYGEELSQKDIENIVNQIRINLMLFRRRDKLPWREKRKLMPWQKSLQIDYCYGEYKDAEKVIKWRPGEGCCGKALEDGDSVAADLCKSTKNAYNMTEEQQEIAGDPLGSVLSIEIYRQEKGEETPDDKPVAILNIDSPHCIRRTKFSDEDIRQSLIKMAQYVGVFL